MVGIIGIPQQLIIGWPAHIIMQGMPLFIMVPSMPHMSFIMSIVAPSPGVIVHFMPFSVMTQLIWQLIGTIIGTGMDMDMGIEGMVPIGFIMGVWAAVFMEAPAYNQRY
jgi:hypothetical protein